MADFNEQVAQKLAKGRETYKTKVSLYDPDFSATDTKYGFPPGLMRAVALIESDWNADAKNFKSGASGIMQITPRTAKQLNVDPLVSRQAIDAAGRHLKELINKYGGRVDLALAAYNGGPTHVDQWIKTGTWSDSNSKRPLQNAAYPHLVLGVMGYDYPLSIPSPKVGENFKFNSTSKAQTPILPTKGTPYTIPQIKDDGTDQFYIGGKTETLPKTVSTPFPSGHVSKAFVDNSPTDSSTKTTPVTNSSESVTPSISAVPSELISSPVNTTPNIQTTTIPQIPGLDPLLNPSLLGIDPYQQLLNTLDTNNLLSNFDSSPSISLNPFAYTQPELERLNEQNQTIPNSNKNNTINYDQGLNPFAMLTPSFISTKEETPTNLPSIIQNWWT